MKKLFTLLFLVSTVVLSAQTDVKLWIDHQLGGNPFAFNLTGSNNLGHNFNVSRLEYYISGIVLEHDGGTLTEIEDYWILANAGTDTTYDLGAYNITTLEAIHFAVGVDPDHNHLDPSTYAAEHPLAPKTPSMHWGWGPGYRFLAVEGKLGSNFDQGYEFHSLGDNYYYVQRIPTAGEIVNDDLLITLHGDYSRIMEHIDMSQALIEHGDAPLNIKTLQNMYNFVFTSVEGKGNSLDPLGIEIRAERPVLSVYPNPSLNGSISLEFGPSVSGVRYVEVRDITGKLIESRMMEVSVKNTFHIRESGFYTITVFNGEEKMLTTSVVVAD